MTSSTLPLRSIPASPHAANSKKDGDGKARNDPPHARQVDPDPLPDPQALGVGRQRAGLLDHAILIVAILLVGIFWQLLARFSRDGKPVKDRRRPRGQVDPDPLPDPQTRR